MFIEDAVATAQEKTGPFTGHDSNATRGSGQEFLETPRVGSRWVGSGRVWCFFKILTIRSGNACPTRPDPTWLDPRGLTRPVNNPGRILHVISIEHAIRSMRTRFIRAFSSRNPTLALFFGTRSTRSASVAFAAASRTSASRSLSSSKLALYIVETLSATACRGGVVLLGRWREQNEKGSATTKSDVMVQRLTAGLTYPRKQPTHADKTRATTFIKTLKHIYTTH